MPPLYDDYGELTDLAEKLRFRALLVGVISGVALIPAAMLGLLSPMICGGGCTLLRQAAVTAMVASPLLLLISTMAGIVAYKSPSWRLFILTFIPPVVTLAAFSGGFS